MEDLNKKPRGGFHREFITLTNRKKEPIPADKQTQSKEIADQVEQFLKKGGKITQIKEGESSFLPIMNSKQLKHLTARSHFNNRQRTAQRADRRMAKIQK